MEDFKKRLKELTTALEGLNYSQHEDFDERLPLNNLMEPTPLFLHSEDSLHIHSPEFLRLV